MSSPTLSSPGGVRFSYVCADCGLVSPLDHAFCPRCGRNRVQKRATTGVAGRVIDVVEIQFPPRGFEHSGPYHVVLVLLDDKSKVVGYVGGDVQLASGERVHVVDYDSSTGRTVFAPSARSAS